MTHKLFMWIVFLILIIPCTSSYSQQTAISISGIISDSLSGETLIGATITISKENNPKIISGTYSNKFGFFSIPSVKSGSYILSCTSIGYSTKTIPIEIKKDNIRIDISLINRTSKTKEITVTAQKEQASIQSLNTVELSKDFLKQMPSIGGETDVFRVLQLMPGIKSASELSSGLYVRGGSPDQNLILLDGVIVYNPSHLGGFLSTFNSDALKDIRMIKGGFPAEYGGRLSSVLDLTMREGTKEHISGSAGISMISSRLTVEGPINDESTFMISGRRMYFDVLTALISKELSDNTPQYYFYDVNAKINYKLGMNDRLFVSGYFGRDVLSEPKLASNEGTTFGLDWGNSTLNTRWMHIFSPTLFTNFSAIYTDYHFSTHIGQRFGTDTNSTQFNFSSLSKIRDYMFRGEAQYFANDNHTIKCGIEAIHHKFTANATDSIDTSQGDLLLRANTQQALEIALYSQDEWKIQDNWMMNAGGRLYYFQNGNYLQFEPRISTQYFLADNLHIHASYARAHQFLHLIVRNDISLPTDLWFPSTENIKPSMSDQVTSGIEYRTEDKTWKFTLDGYYKEMSNLYEYKDTASFTLGLPLEQQFTSGKGTSYGMEVFINKQIGSLTGWIGYTLSWTNRTFAELNRGRTFFPRYDRRHDISVALSWKLGSSWELGATWVYGTGQAYTMPTSKYVIPDFTGNNGIRVAYDFSERNGYRLPPFHKLDLNFIHLFSWFGLPMQFSINIYNAYNRLNPFAQYIADEYDSNTKTNKTVVKQITLFPFIPTFGLSATF